MRYRTRFLVVALLASVLSAPLVAAPFARADRPILTAPSSQPAPVRSPLAIGLSLLAVIGMAAMGSVSDIAKKFVTRAAQAAPDYKTGVAKAGGEWEARTAASEDAYAGGVTAAIGRKAFSKGVREAGAGRYQERASGVGAARYPQGVQSAEQAFAQGFAPVAQAIQSAQASLPPRGPRRSPQNQQRANHMAMALGAWKEGR